MAAIDMSRLPQGWRVVVALGKQSAQCKQCARCHMLGLWACLVRMAAADMSRLPQGWRVVAALGKDCCCN
jgi:uncharacterized protein YbdZ (MbtH family)